MTAPRRGVGRRRAGGTRKPGKTPIAAEIAAQVMALTCTEPRQQGSGAAS
jgi:hypothetical protein